MATTSDQMRAWRGPALFTYGFRPFFLGAGVWAALSMTLWIAWLAGAPVLGGKADPVAWHAHEFLFGYLGAVLAGFLFTAVPNWTGRLPICGWPLAGLFGLWLLGRLAMLAPVPPLAAALADLAFPAALAAAIARELIAGKNWRNLIVLAMLLVFLAANAWFHLDLARGGSPAQGGSLRLGLAAGIMMISVIGGRIVPSFTRNWMVKRGLARLPAPPMQGFDKIALLVTLLALLAWVVMPDHAASGGALVVAGLVQAARLHRWGWLRTGAEPLVWVLHLGYGMVPLGALLLGGAILSGQAALVPAAQHVWMAGAIGLMTLAVMTRATKGHSGQDLTAGPGTVAVYLGLVVAVAARVLAGFMPSIAGDLYTLSGLAWIGTYALFAGLYGPLLMRRRPGKGA